MFQLVSNQLFQSVAPLKKHRAITVSLMTVVLAACGGGDDFGAAAPDRTGVFLDSSAVEGLTYETATRSGTTNAAGEFDFTAGENVTFSIGGFALPSVQATALVSPINIFGASDPADQRVADLSRLLQTLDTDRIASNGLTLPATIQSLTSDTRIDFGTGNFDAQAQLALSQINGNPQAPQGPLVDTQTASAELTEALVVNEVISEGCTSDHPNVGRSAELSTIAHGVTGTITVLNDCVLEVTNFNYDGGGPAVYFFAGTDSNYRSNAFMIGPQLNGVQWVNDTVRLPIPDGMSLDDFNSLSVWCFQFDANFGDAVL